MNAAEKVTTTVSEPGDRPALRQWIALWSLLLGSFMGMLDFFIVNVAAPSIQANLHTPFSDIQFAIVGYTLAYATGPSIGGRLGDAYGRRLLFVVGVIVFGLASIACAAAAGPAALITARVVQGLGAALMLPQVLALIQITFTGRDRVRAIGLYGAVAPVGAIAGQITGGALVRLDVGGLGWRMIFLVNIPFCVIAATGALLTVPKARGASRAGFDLLGAGLLSVALLALLYPLVDGTERGWSTTATVELVASVVLVTAFAMREWRVGLKSDTALLPLRMFREQGFAMGLPTVLVFYSGNSGLILILSYYLQKGINLTPFDSGMMFVPLGIASAIAALTARRLVERYGHWCTISGTVFMLAGLMLAWVAIGAGDDHSAQAAALLPGLMLAAGGQGLIAPSLIGLVLAGVVREDAGAASGGLLTATQVANALGVAAIGALFTVLVADHGYRAAFGICLFVLCGLAAATFVFLLLLRPKDADCHGVPGWKRVADPR